MHAGERNRKTMQYLLSFLPLLACPLMMGGMMWLIMRSMRGDKEQIPANSAEISPRREGELRGVSRDRTTVPETPAQAQPSFFKAIWDCIQMCLNWKVLVGLVGVAALIGVFAPHLLFVALPTLLILVCPLSMGIMLLRMGRMRQTASAGDASCPACEPGQTDPAQPHQSFEQPLSISERPPVLPRS